MQRPSGILHRLSSRIVPPQSRFVSWVASRQRIVDFVIGGLFVCYLLYVLMLSKLFSATIEPARFRDLGILWNLSDHVFQHRHYEIGQNFFPPSNAILIHAFGMMNRELAFRIYLLVQASSFILVLWIWCRCLGITKRPDRFLIVLTAFLAAHYYVHFEFHMHNLNLITLCLVSAAVFFRRVQVSSFSYALALAIKPHSSVLVLPWMAWQGYFRWTAHALFWLFIFFGVLPVLCFGFSGTATLHREWLTSLVIGGTGDTQAISVKAGIAAMLETTLSDRRVELLNWIAQGFWILTLAIFFLPTLVRRAPGSAFTMAAELAAILLAALPFGALQQPARGVVLLVAMLVVAAAAFSGQSSTRSRAALFGVLVFVGVSTHVMSTSRVQFLLTLPICIVSLFGLALARREPPPRVAPGGLVSSG